MGPAVRMIPCDPDVLAQKDKIRSDLIPPTAHPIIPKKGRPATAVYHNNAILSRNTSTAGTKVTR